MVDWTLKSISFSFSNWSSSLLALCHSCPQSSSRYPHSCTWISYSHLSQESDPENMCVCVCVYAWACVYLWHYYWSHLYSVILCSRADSLHLHVILHEWTAFYNTFLNIHWSGVLTALADICIHIYIHTYIYIHTIKEVR